MKKDYFLKKGFTLIEILVVVSIIGFITTIVLVSLNSAKEKAQETANIRQLEEVKKALAMFYADNGYYPDIDIKGLSNVLSGVNDNNKIYISEITDNPLLIYSVNNCNEINKCSGSSLILFDLKDVGNMNWDNGVKKCASLGERLPTKEEIIKIAEGGFSNFVNGGYYWTSTNDPIYPQYKILAVYSGSDQRIDAEDYGDKADSYNIRCVKE